MLAQVAHYVAETCRPNLTFVAPLFYVLLHFDYFVVSVIGTRYLVYRPISNRRVHYPTYESLPFNSVPSQSYGEVPGDKSTMYIRRTLY